MNSLRIVFSKSKNAVFLTHIDVFNVFEQAFIRADIKIKYTEKKNSKPIIVFADPLPKGIESVGEIVEVKLEEKLDIPYFVKQINSVLPSGLTVLNAEYYEDDNVNIMEKVYASTYLISLIYDNNKLLDKTPRQVEEIKRNYINNLKKYLEQDKISIVKKSKSRMERIDIKSDIINFDFLLDGSLEITVCSGLRKKLDISNLMDGYFEYISEKLNYNVKRTRILYA